jgi:hypothetical protein
MYSWGAPGWREVEVQSEQEEARGQVLVEEDYQDQSGTQSHHYLSKAVQSVNKTISLRDFYYSNLVRVFF